MTREIVHEARYYCDGCGHAVVESTVDYIDQAFEQCGWLHTTTPLGAEMDYCPVCRADNPFEAVQRVRELHHFVVDEIETREGPEDVQHCSECGYIPTDEEPCPTIRILDGAA